MKHRTLNKHLSFLLPEDARIALIAASQIANAKERQAAIEAATERIQKRYPRYFRRIAA